MLQPEFDFHPDNVTGDIVFSWLMKREKLGQIVNQEEIVEMVLKLGKFDVFPNSIWLTQMIRKFCRNGKTYKTFGLLIEMMMIGASIKTTSCNALLTELARTGDFYRMNEVMAKMKELGMKWCRSW